MERTGKDGAGPVNPAGPKGYSMKIKTLAAAMVLSIGAGAIHAAAIAPPGQALAQKLDAMDVEHHWIAGTHVNWKTGDPDRGTPDKSHCSVFVAAACDRMGVYILRPPDHGQVHLATAQQAWLSSEGAAKGWKPVHSPFDAQRLANEGKIVVAVYASPDPKKAGHVAIVRPSDKSESRIRHEGPDVIQAGMENANSTSLKEGFRHHRGAWESTSEYGVLFYMHEP
jgi:hypothetical protein